MNAQDSDWEGVLWNSDLAISLSSVIVVFFLFIFCYSRFWFCVTALCFTLCCRQKSHVNDILYIFFATFGGFHERAPDIVKCLNVWSPVSSIVWVGFRRCGLARRNMSPRLGFEVSKATDHFSCAFHASLGSSRCVLSAVSATMPDACCHASLIWWWWTLNSLELQSPNKPSISCLCHGVLSMGKYQKHYFSYL